jgi:DNA repair exonuclease SbcCD ATPase subunit
VATPYKEYLQLQRRRRIEQTLPSPLGEKAIAGTSLVRAEMTDISLRLVLVQSALGMSLDGKTRATATEVVDRAEEEADSLVLASTAGQVFSAMGVRRVSVHGQRRLVLEFDQLKALHDELVQQFEEIKPKAEEAAERFEGLMENVQELEERVERIYHKAAREKYLREFIVEYERNPRTLADLEKRYQSLEAQARRRDQLEAGMEGLSQRAKDLPSLEEGRQHLQAKLDEHKKEEGKLAALEKDITEREGALGSRLLGLKRRLALVELTELEETVKTRRRELDQETRERRKALRDLDRQIRSQRSLLDRILGREKDEDGA